MSLVKEVLEERTPDDRVTTAVRQGGKPWLLNMDNPFRVAARKVPMGGVDDWVGFLIPEVFDKLYWQKSLPRTGLNPMMVTSLGSTLIRPASRIVGVNRACSPRGEGACFSLPDAPGAPYLQAHAPATMWSPVFIL